MRATTSESLTYDLFVSTVFSRANIDEVKQRFAPCKAAHKLFKLRGILVDSFAYKHVAEAPHVRIDAADDTGSVGDIVTVVVNVFLDGSGEI